MLHFSAWEKGVKSLYYCRSKSVQRAGYANREESTAEQIEMPKEKTDYEECLACQ